MIFQVLPVLLLLFTSILGVHYWFDYEKQVAKMVETNSIVPGYTVCVSGPGSKVALEDEYSREELEFITELKSLSERSKRSLLSSLKLDCFGKDLAGTCCISWNVDSGTPTKTCVEIGLRLTDMTAFAALYYNGTELIETHYCFSKLCWGLPSPLSNLNICLWVYHLKSDTNLKSFELCSVLEIANIIQTGGACMKYEKGKFSFTDDIKPPTYNSSINLPLFGGKLKFKMESPEVVSGIKKWFEKSWKNFAELFQSTEQAASSGNNLIVKTSIILISIIPLIVINSY